MKAEAFVAIEVSFAQRYLALNISHRNAFLVDTEIQRYLIGDFGIELGVRRKEAREEEGLLHWGWGTLVIGICDEDHIILGHHKPATLHCQVMVGRTTSGRHFLP